MKNAEKLILPDHWYKPREISRLGLLSDIAPISERAMYHFVLRLIKQGDLHARITSRTESKIPHFRVKGRDLLAYLNG